MNWGEFFAMGGYAFYVWGSYALAAIVLAANVILPWRARYTLTQRLRQPTPRRAPRAAALNRTAK